MTAALRTGVEVCVSVLVSAVHAAVAVVVHAAVAHVVTIHHVYHVHDNLWVVRGVSVYLHVEDVTTTGQVMVGSFYLSLVACAALVVHGHMVRVGVVVTVGDAWQCAKLLAVFLGELSRQSFGRCGEDAVVVLVLLAEVFGAVAHVGHDLDTQCLCFFRLSVVLSHECHETFCQSDEPNAQGALVDDALNGVVWLKLFTATPQF